MTDRNAEAERVWGCVTRLADMGFHLFPIHYRSKDPATQRGFHDGTNDAGLIAYRFKGKRYNIGIACGASGIFVVDEDAHNAYVNYAASKGQTLPYTFIVNTRDGRRHFYYRMPDRPLGSTVKYLSPDIDTRGAGGYVIGPGSTHETGAVYTALDWDAPIAETPAWLQDVLRARQAASTPIVLDASGQGLTAYDRIRVMQLPTLRKLANRVKKAQEGERNSTLYRCACDGFERVRCGVDDEESVKDALTNAGFAAGLTGSEIVATITSARRKKLEGVRA